MFYRIMLSFYGLIFAMVMVTTQAQAVSLGKIDVASHLGEPFYAEVPITLDQGEEVSSMFVELASPADYRILEVYRDQTLNSVRTDVLSDSRGTRVELTSRTSLDSPFFNIILKVRHGRATHYKKYPVFLDLPKTTLPQAGKAPVPVITMEEAAVTGPIATVSPVNQVAEQSMAVEETVVSGSFTPFDGWARTGHYGPMVYGDTISTVADRLRIDNRYTRNQVMVAMFEKNRSKFDQDNINLIKAGTHLDIPMAEEVERIRPEQAREIMHDHNQRWRELMKQPRYAAVAEAQKNRYSKRVRAGDSASGVAPAPVSGQASSTSETGAENVNPVVEPVAGMDESGSPAGMEGGADTAEINALNASVAELEKENEALKAKLAESDAKAAELASKVGNEDVKAADDARVKKLELRLARLQAELDNARQSSAGAEGPNWLLLAGGGLVLLLLGGGAGYLMRRERKHPAMNLSEESFSPMETEGGFEMPAAPEVAAEEIEVEPVVDFASAEPEHTDTESFEEAFTDSIPDLTDEETGEMEAFKEDIEDEPDPNVDYLSEADVYMRYGMEDEAEKQVQMALKLRENNKDAHVKLVQIRKARGDESGADEAIATARMTLVGDTLSNFESTIANITTGGGTSEDVSLEDTIPPGTLDVSEDPQAHESIDAAEEIDELADIEFEQEELPVPPVKTAAESEGAATMELGDFDFPSSDATIESAAELKSEELPELADSEAEEPTVLGESEIETEEVAGDEETVTYETNEGLDFDLSGLELPEESSEKEAPVSEFDFETSQAEEPEEIEAQVSEDVQSMDDDGLNLSDFDLSDDSVSAKAGAAEEELQTADLEKTLVMDWTKNTVTSGDYDIGGESGAGEAEGLSFDLGYDLEVEAAAVEEPTAEPTVEEPMAEPTVEEDNEPEEHLSSVEFDLDDLNVDLEAPVSSDDVDDFSSTIQTSTAEIQASALEMEEKSGDTVDLEEGAPAAEKDVSLDFEVRDETPAVSNAPKKSKASQIEALDHDATVRINADAFSLEDMMGDDKDFDATMELDSLMSELSKEQGSDDEDKKS